MNLYLMLSSLKFKVRLSGAMIADFVGCWLVENICKRLFADLEPKEMVTRGRERREQRRQAEEVAKKAEESAKKEQ